MCSLVWKAAKNPIKLTVAFKWMDSTFLPMVPNSQAILCPHPKLAADLLK